ncbi:alcohol dehydrogenase catalytic domain-containing protein [Caldilinea sp.]|uniref:alcohol dehydrogenase catalytic domain-containing protein n=1 Tax=Caldilinea sp. TaxID=2293560 RepID=UPI002CB16C24|nr:alcohol dehydrogenase catalytic domain-containing protein [Caldilinea sp.]
MTSDPIESKLGQYRKSEEPLSATNRLWPLYGAGWENLGKEGGAMDLPMPHPGPDELLVRQDAVGICFSDIKVIRAGEKHPRIHRSMKEQPVVLGHEVALTVVVVGENLQEQYQPGDRFIVQADIYIGGKAYAYGYELQGGFSKYSIVDWRVLNGDHGNYLIPVKPEDGYAEVALCEPWACVEASYTVVYRTQWQEGGGVWLVGDGHDVSLGAAVDWRPAKVVLDVTDSAFAAQVRTWAADAGVEIQEGDDGVARYDDIVVLGADAALCERAFPRMANGAILNLVLDRPLERAVAVDIGRMHYDHLLVVGTDTQDLAASYTPVRTQLKAGGRCWILGAAGPMGQMHLLRALSMPGKPAKVVATNLHTVRMKPVRKQFARQAAELGVEIVFLSRDAITDEEAFLQQKWTESDGQGYDDVVVMAPTTEAVQQAALVVADNAVINVFAGLARGTLVELDLNPVAQRGVRYTGTSGSSIEDLRHMRDLVESKQLPTNHSVAAIAGLEGVGDGLRAVAEGQFAGKVVIYPNLNRPLPLTPLTQLETVLPQVAAKLDADGMWTRAAEDELLRVML